MHNSQKVLPVLSLLAACSAEQPTSIDRSQSSHSIVVQLAHPEYYKEHSRRVVVGRRQDAGCRFSGRDSMHVGAHVFEWTVQYDLTSCNLTLAEGDYLGPRRVREGAGKTNGDSLIRMEVPSLSSLALRSNASLSMVECDNQPDSRYIAYQHMFVEDPLEVDVTSDELWLDYYSRPELNCIQTGTYQHTAWWNAPTGWGNIGFGTYAHYIEADRSFTEVKVHSDDMNILFCDPSLYTYSFYPMSGIRGFPDGWVIFEWDYYIDGDCSYLLHFNRERSVI